MDYQAVIPEFVVSDIEKSRHFYCDLLGFSVEYERPEEKFLFLSLEDCQLMLEEGSSEECRRPAREPFRARLRPWSRPRAVLRPGLRPSRGGGAR